MEKEQYVAQRGLRIHSGVMDFQKQQKKEFQEDLGYGPVLEAAPGRAPQIKVMILRADFLP